MSQSKPYHVVIPTYKRVGKLARCLESLRRQTFQDFTVTVVADNECVETQRAYRDGIIKPDSFEVNVRQEKAIRTWNRNLREIPERPLVYLCDDVELAPDCLEKAHEFIQTLNHDDYLLGFNQQLVSEYTPCKVAMGIIGPSFSLRFPARQVFCPDYDNMGVDAELAEYAESVGRLFYRDDAKLTHYHPCMHPSELDETHTITREHSKRDRTTRRERKERGYLWGKNFGLLHA